MFLGSSDYSLNRGDSRHALFENKPRALQPRGHCGGALSRNHPNETNSFFAESLQSLLGLPGVDDKHGLPTPADLPYRPLLGLLTLYGLYKKPFSLGRFGPQLVPVCLCLYLASLLLLSPRREALLDPTKHALYGA
jgi:hypothetical protein